MSNVRADGDSESHLHDVVASTVQSFDSPMLLDPLEEQVDLPPAHLELLNDDGEQAEMVDQEQQPSAPLDVVELIAVELRDVQLKRLDTRQYLSRFANSNRAP